ncbi:MAG: acetoacetate decarboxylase family protein [Desulfobacterales bacterium]
MRDDPFFKGNQRKVLEMKGESFEFPVLYYDFRIISATFTAKTDRIKKLLPHPNFKPVEIFPGTGMVIFIAFEYRDTSIGPYNEVGISVPVKFPPTFAFPGLSAISMMRKRCFSVYIHHLPVTTEIARKGGVYFYNYPKFMSRITFQDQDDGLEVILREDEELIFKMNAKKIPLNQSAQIEFHTYSIKDNMVMHTLVEGWAPRYGVKMMGNKAKLELGNHRISQEMAELNLSKNASTGQYAEGMMSKLYSPDRSWDVNTLAVISD